MLNTTAAVFGSRKKRYRGRIRQIGIYFGKFLRMFVYRNDWKVFPMAVLIAGLVSMVVRRDFFLTMEGTLKGAFALTCVGIWNGCFNSIQVIVRERAVIKREHRSGMHVSSYIVAHMLYQALLCLGQSGLTLYVLKRLGVSFPDRALVTPWLIVDLCISLFLITYASDMMSLFISAISKTTTGAMTVMPFLLIFQLIFSGALFNLPVWTAPLSNLTVSTYGIKCVAAQGDYNSCPMATGWSTLKKLENQELSVSFTVGQIFSFLAENDSPAMEKLRETKIYRGLTFREFWELFKGSPYYEENKDRPLQIEIPMEEAFGQLREEPAIKAHLDERIALTLTLEELLEALQTFFDSDEMAGSAAVKSLTLGEAVERFEESEKAQELFAKEDAEEMTVGDLLAFVKENHLLEGREDQVISLQFTLKELLEIIGAEKVQSAIEQATAKVSYNPAYEHSRENVFSYWGALLRFVLIFALLSILVLELIDRDKR